jgi:hypothetical protein
MTLASFDRSSWSTIIPLIKSAIPAVTMNESRVYEG